MTTQNVVDTVQARDAGELEDQNDTDEAQKAEEAAKKLAEEAAKKLAEEAAKKLAEAAKAARDKAYKVRHDNPNNQDAIKKAEDAAKIAEKNATEAYNTYASIGDDIGKKQLLYNGFSRFINDKTKNLNTEMNSKLAEMNSKLEELKNFISDSNKDTKWFLNEIVTYMKQLGPTKKFLNKKYIQQCKAHQTNNNEENDRYEYISEYLFIDFNKDVVNNLDTWAKQLERFMDTKRLYPVNKNSDSNNKCVQQVISKYLKKKLT